MGDWGSFNDEACWKRSKDVMADPVKPPCKPGAPDRWMTAQVPPFPTLVYRAARAVGWQGGPKRTVLAMIEWYQTNVSAGRDLCSRPAPYNCSNRTAWAITNYGLFIGVLIGLWGLGHTDDGCEPDNDWCLPKAEHRPPRDDYWWSKCVGISMFGGLSTLACNDGPSSSYKGNCCGGGSG